ncbi:hypothetical protein J9317_11540 [Metabacillus sp. KIGAM252]|uniref:Uncharacterized protein n=1 Tax=Metabacillus flavus TaxID=2823519 RepID=A0ABS5LFL8_9BACI|nr:hypothetical protein [Metabacillus flavus]MBS2969398.1 hypothetical protein [Metabacillus flavus]
MAYILDQVTLWNEGKICRVSISVEDNRFRLIRDDLNRSIYLRMNLEEYIMTPGHVFLDTMEEGISFSAYKKHMTDLLLAKGCTAIISAVPVSRVRELKQKVKMRRQLLVNSSADYYIAVKCPLRALTPSLIYEAKKHGIAIMFAEISSDLPFTQFNWQQLRDSLYLNPITIVPVWKGTEPKAEKQWYKFMKKIGIPVLPHALAPLKPLPSADLMNLGIYPEKGLIRPDGDVDYNLYKKTGLSDSVETRPLLDYDSHIPTITIHRGRVVKALDRIYFHPGSGEEKNILIRSAFARPLSLI